MAAQYGVFRGLGDLSRGREIPPGRRDNHVGANIVSSSQVASWEDRQSRTSRQHRTMHCHLRYQTHSTQGLKSSASRAVSAPFSRSCLSNRKRTRTRRRDESSSCRRLSSSLPCRPTDSILVFRCHGQPRKKRIWYRMVRVVAQCRFFNDRLLVACAE